MAAGTPKVCSELARFMFQWWTSWSKVQSMPGQSYRRDSGFKLLLLYLCHVFRALINSLVCYDSADGNICTFSTSVSARHASSHLVSESASVSLETSLSKGPIQIL